MIRIPQGLHGAHLRDRLLDHLGRAGLRDALREGRLVSYSRAVVVQRELVTDPHTRAAAALLSAGPPALLTGRTSAWLHGCTAASTDDVHLLLGYDHQYRPRQGEVRHHANYDASAVVVIDGLRCHAIVPTLGDMLCRDDRAMAFTCTNEVLAALDPKDRAGFIADVDVHIARRPDSRGRRRGGFLLDLATGEPESPAESRTLLLLVDEGFPVPRMQYPVCDLDGRVLWRLDFAWPDRRLALEYDGYAAHVDRVEADRARDEDLRRRGWRVVHADASDLRRPARLIECLSAYFAVSERTTRGV
ncbi:hypothetical protein GCM10022243_06950 [Saccharothrix violaceirubra]|uniref:DUF559 domain-containing protein n=1 Tax=Saccharothrix violaceirubra TaxID=413306 RepID=A0A7W7WTV3_9PSEU|nr:hypothetical protein [Saccharothrix violaceirubra]MBB4963107.1 hypothetical protein [Saccharothrix violaceirubra]